MFDKRTQKRTQPRKTPHFLAPEFAAFVVLRELVLIEYQGFISPVAGRNQGYGKHYYTIGGMRKNTRGLTT